MTVPHHRRLDGQRTAGVEVHRAPRGLELGGVDGVTTRVGAVLDCARNLSFDQDIRRCTAMVRGGWLVARFVYGDVMHPPAYVHETLADLVRVRTTGTAPRLPRVLLA